MADLYKFAAQRGLRFPSGRGSLIVEQLYQLPLVELDKTARTINTELKGMGEESFLTNTQSNPRKTELSVALDIVKDVIATKEAENAAERAKISKTAERKKILDALGAKKDAALTAASVEELEKKLAALEE